MPSHLTPIITTQLYGRMPSKRVRDVRACLNAYSLALELIDKYATLPSAPNVHYGVDAIYAGLMQLSVGGGSESTMEDLALRYGMEAPCWAGLLYRLKKVGYEGWYSRLRDVNEQEAEEADTVRDQLGGNGREEAR